MELPLREQGTLLTVIRGCDLTPKYPLDSTERHLVAFLRWCVMNPADPREVDFEPGCFHRSTPPEPFKPSALGHYPQHWFAHIMHATEVIGYRHPSESVAITCQALYWQMVRSLHLNPESKQEMIDRLSEDRLLSGTVVS